MPKIKNSKLLYKTLLFTGVFVVLFTLDQLTKFLFFEENNPGVIKHDFTIIGIRSQFHESTTFFDFISLDLPLSVSILISLGVILLLVGVFFAVDNTIATVGLAFSLAGALGNTVDNIFDGGVRNVFFFPLSDQGTFNLADVLIVLGGGVFLGGLIYEWIKTRKPKE